MNELQEVYSMNEMTIHASKRDEVWKDKVFIKGGYLTLNIRYPYEIELCRIDTKDKLLGWICHLMEKNWVNKEVLNRMIWVCDAHFHYGIDLSC